MARVGIGITRPSVALALMLFLGLMLVSQFAYGASSTTNASQRTAVSTETSSSQTQPMYRLYNPRTEEHLYTANAKEARILSTERGWKYEGIAWYAPKTSSTPVYRLYRDGAHHYTASKHEHDVLVNQRGWRDEGIGWYSDDAKTVAVYRVYKPGRPLVSAHHYTTSAHEQKVLVTSRGWKSEGIGWYAKKAGIAQSRWEGLRELYTSDTTVKQLIFVKYTGGTRATVELWVKKSGLWKKSLTCAGYVGKYGIGKTREGDMRTPEGTFGITRAFGIKSSPGTALSYLKVNNYHYWCGDRHAYNQLVDVRKDSHQCRGEHLIDYRGHYNYGLFLDFNTNPVVYGGGSAIFMHCNSGSSYTAGCVAVSEPNMIKIIQRLSSGAKICIYPQ